MLISQKFLTHHPFAVLVDLGWVCESLGPPVMRRGASEFIRVATFGRGRRSACMDVDRHGQMSQFATYDAGEDTGFTAETPTALIALVQSPDGTPVQLLASIRDVTTRSML
ncbi:hypothetical protein [Rhodococcus sp. NBC_00297]|uniref:hypothetical protein n=1 Tax=Rhodococcus sp. NBC_00297 TaxID=2976005 RepID=UPI002E2905A4|nr:hypothetical protein [Rhodococcus sp. NBC_00297]